MTLWELVSVSFLAAMSLWAVWYPHHCAIRASQVRPAWEEMGKAMGAVVYSLITELKTVPGATEDADWIDKHAKLAGFNHRKLVSKGDGAGGVVFSDEYVLESWK